MEKSHLPRLFAPHVFVMMIIGLTACSKPYEPPQLQTSEGAPGILRLLPPLDTSDGAARPASGKQALRGRLIATHGMCSHNHQENWVDTRTADYKRALGAVVDENPQEITPFEYGAGAVFMDRVLLRTTNGTFELVLLRWGSHVNDARQRMEFDNYRANEAAAPTADEAIGAHPERGKLSGLARAELMNRCLIDAVVYSGTAGHPIRHTMRQAMCAAIGGHSGATSGGDRGAPGSTMACPGAERADSVPTVLLPESLGSTIMLDAVVALNANSQQAARSAVKGIYMLANQFPLLSEANREIESAEAHGGAGTAIASLGSLSEFINPPDARARGKTLDEIQLIAITDPNDVLGSRIHPASLEDKAVVSNVLVSNAVTVLGLASNPLQAHSGWSDNKTVFDVLARGLPIDTSLR